MPVPFPSYFPSANDIYNLRAKNLGSQAEERRRMAEQLFFQAQQQLQRASQMQQPALHQPLGKSDLLPLLLAGGLAKLLGARDLDLALGGQGFLQGREAYAQTANQNAQNAFLGKQHGLEVLAQLGQQGSEFQSRRADELSNDQRFTLGLADKMRSDADQRERQRQADANTRIEELQYRLKLAHPSEIPALAATLNQAYQVAGLPPMGPEAVVEMARDRARSLLRDKRVQVYNSIAPFREEPEQAKLAKWLVSLGDDEFTHVAQLSDAEILKAAKAGSEPTLQPDPRGPRVKSQVAQVLMNSHLKPEIINDVAKHVKSYPLEFQVRAAKAMASLTTPGADKMSALKALASIDAAAIRQLESAYNISQKGLRDLPAEVVAQYQQAMMNLHEISQAMGAIKSPPVQQKPPPPLASRLGRSGSSGYQPYRIGPALGGTQGAIVPGLLLRSAKRAPSKTGRTPNGTAYQYESTP